MQATKQIATGEPCYAITTCRVSTVKQQDENHSLSRQEESVLAAAKRLGVTIPEDGQWSCAVSSKKGRNIHRKDLAEMLAYCKKHKRVKYCIVDEPDRFMRSISEAYYFEVEFGKLGVTVYYACDEILNGNDSAAKVMRFMRYFTAETSNDERERKTRAGFAKAIRDGRWPSQIRLGYEKTTTPGVHAPAPIVGDMIKSLLVRVANGTITPSESVAEFNRSDYVISGQHARYRLDNWRKLVLTCPYYAGILSLNTKDGVLYNENGLHQPLITKHQHEMILAAVNNWPKTQTGPRKGGNPKYRLNTITYCERCHRIEEANGKDLRHNLGKFVGYDNRNGKTTKVYERYGCRKCHNSLSRDALHQGVQDCFSQIDLSDEGRRMFKEELQKAWKQEEQTNKDEIARLRTELRELQVIKSNLITALGRTSSQDVAGEIEKDIENKVQQAKEIEGRIAKLQNICDDDRADFMDFAMQYTDNLAADFFNLPLEKVKVCKELVFPGGFWVDLEKRVYTPEISPIYRYRTQKRSPKTTANVSMVVDECKTLHTTSKNNKIATPPTNLTNEEIKLINADVERWYELLDVHYMYSKQNQR